jgi:hypothetical protein
LAAVDYIINTEIFLLDNPELYTSTSYESVSGANALPPPFAQSLVTAKIAPGGASNDDCRIVLNQSD